ncbi:uncharacterized protein EV422DRAFT_532326 [Fimicolochytrium jonesii]|uniref:uncharacterized protein n=1 Tax=Fimicolochytrium jonesii TaxID=1396493 RepID=UPI0022FE86C3|nr:uncharacterized protein EV422DRAFT_532326 [Fimicolochytrium jonesii]KAI8820296.1 hypothetical protein EV422DRAFT_532326 [Fimicolochytrium jonesii]
MQETNSGESVNESLLKCSLGGDKIDYRPLFKEAREFYPHFKMILCTNNPLTIKGTDHGSWRKIRMVPFESRFVAKTDKVAEKEGSPPAEPIEHLVQDAEGDAVFETDPQQTRHPRSLSVHIQRPHPLCSHHHFPLCHR